MTGSEPAPLVDGVAFVQAPEDPSVVYYLPTMPLPSRDPAGEPAVSLLVAGDTGFLTLGARLEASATTLDALRGLALRSAPGLRPEAIRLAPLPAVVEAAELRMADATGAFETLAKVTTSGYPPYAAVFGVRLDKAQCERARLALAGREGLLKVRYAVRPGATAKAPVPAPADGREAFEADVGAWFPGGAGPGHVHGAP